MRRGPAPAATGAGRRRRRRLGATRRRLGDQLEPEAPGEPRPPPRSVAGVGAIAGDLETTPLGRAAAVCSTHVRDPAPDSIGSDGWSVSTATSPNAITRTSPAHDTQTNGPTSKPAPTTVVATACSSATGSLDRERSTSTASRSGTNSSAVGRRTTSPSPARWRAWRRRSSSAATRRLRAPSPWRCRGRPPRRLLRRAARRRPCSCRRQRRRAAVVVELAVARRRCTAGGGRRSAPARRARRRGARRAPGR